MKILLLLLIGSTGCALKSDVIKYGTMRYYEGRLSVYKEVLKDNTNLSKTVNQLHEDHRLMIKETYPKLLK